MQHLVRSAVDVLGPVSYTHLDTGYDVINTVNCGEAVAGVLNALEETGELPRTILYSFCLLYTSRCV